MKNNKHIARCGLDCSKCDAYIATKNNDYELKVKTAKAWNERYKNENRDRNEIKPEDINCKGCLSAGPIYMYCRRCEIRNCALNKNLKNCQDCENYRCEKLIELQKHFF